MSALVAVGGTAVLILATVAFWGLRALELARPTIEESRTVSVAVARDVLGVPVRRACLGLEGDGVRTLIAESEVLSAAALQEFRSRVSVDARPVCNVPATVGVPDDVPSWFDWDPGSNGLVDRCDYGRYSGYTMVTYRSDQTVLVWYRDFGPASPIWPSESELEEHWQNCR